MSEEEALKKEEGEGEYGAVPTYDATELEEAKNEGPVFRDIFFAILFLIHVVALVVVAFSYAKPTWSQLAAGDIHFTFSFNETTSISAEDIIEDEDNEDFFEAMTHFIDVHIPRVISVIIVPSAIISYAIAFLFSSFVIAACPQVFVIISLCSLLLYALLLLIVSPEAGIIAGGIFGAISICYVCCVWKWIPFAAVNLKVSLYGLRANCGIYLVALLYAVLSFLFVLAWLYVAGGTLLLVQINYVENNPPAEGMSETEYQQQIYSDPTFVGIFLAFLLSFYWTSSVFTNSIQVIVAGVMATWCYDVNAASGCCSSAILGSWCRAMTYSFGSICFGSLLEAIIAVLQFIVSQARAQDASSGTDRNIAISLLLCLLECILQLLGDLLDYFNEWAYVFCGIYGSSYLQSGRKVIELFLARGLTALVTNTLVKQVLNWTAIFVGFLTGFLTFLVQAWVEKNNEPDLDEELSYVFGPLSGAQYWGFGLAFFVGSVIAFVMMSVIRGSVNTMIVCFADSPAKVEENHPVLAREISDAWAQAYPDVSSGLGAISSNIVV